MSPARVPLVSDLNKGRRARAESDKTGNGDGTLTFAAATRYVQVWNGGMSALRITSGDITRYVPPGSDTVEFPKPASSFSISTSGDWIARSME